MAERVLVTREIPEAGLRPLEDYDVTVLSERPPERGELLEAAQGIDGVLSTLTEKIDAEFMNSRRGEPQGGREHGRRLRQRRRGDRQRAGHRRHQHPGRPGETTADTAFMLLLAAARRLGEGERIVRSGKWEAWGPKMLLGPDVWGKKLG
jgi:glyoxylate reductase